MKFLIHQFSYFLGEFIVNNFFCITFSKGNLIKKISIKNIKIRLKFRLFGVETPQFGLKPAIKLPQIRDISLNPEKQET